MSRQPDPTLDTMSKVDRLLARQRETIARAEAIVAGASVGPILPEEMTHDHPLAKLLGFEAANALVDTPARRRADRAEKIRADIMRMSCEGRLVREIAYALGVSYGYVVQLRMSLGVTRSR